MDDTQSDADIIKKRNRWRQNLRIIFGSLLYIAPLFWLWHKSDYPDSFGVHITDHGKAALLENWWYSYLLLERHKAWDIVLFIYMWAAVAGFIGALVWAVAVDRRTKHEAAITHSAATPQD